MTIREATSFRIAELCQQKNLSGYSVSYRAGMPSSTYKSIINGKSKNPRIVNINKIADGLGVSIREFYNSDTDKVKELSEKFIIRHCSMN